jgi:hypothetical protein
MPERSRPLSEEIRRRSTPLRRKLAIVEDFLSGPGAIVLTAR